MWLQFQEEMMFNNLLVISLISWLMEVSLYFYNFFYLPLQVCMTKKNEHISVCFIVLTCFSTPVVYVHYEKKVIIQNTTALL